ncbi:MAG: MFS transporter [Chloroflexi bacterium]|nr:MFS transporter [Chloroflexota bacterium]
MRIPSRRTASPNLILLVVCVGIFVAALDQTVIYGAMSDIMFDLHMNVTHLDQVSWLVSGYLLGYTFTMPLVGRISDAYGHRRVYIISMLVFMAGSVLVSMSMLFASMENFNCILAARVVQAIGGGAVVPAGMAIVGDTYPEKRRAIAMGVIGAAVEGGGALGPLYGASIAQYMDWRWIFWINVPVGIAVITLILLKVRPSSRTSMKIDYQGGLLLAVALALLSLGLSQQLQRSNAEFYMTGLLASSAILFGLFIRRLAKSPEPLFRLSMFRHAAFAAANSTHLFIGGALIIALVVIPVMAYSLMELSDIEVGLRLARLTFAIPVGAVIGGLLCHRFGYRIPTALGLVASGAGFFLMSRWTEGISEPWLTVHLAICGLGFGFVIAPITTAVLDSAGEGDRGIASAMVIAIRMIGMVIGLSFMNSLGMGHFHTVAAGMSMEEMEEELRPFALSMFQDFFLAAAIVCAVAILPAMWMRSKRH